MPNPIPSYSKAPWGLSAYCRYRYLLPVIQFHQASRQDSAQINYTIRAGRNLPDKEFRYLRTVIVTAAVHWGFNSELSLLLLTFQHWAGVSPYTSPYSLA